jgi:pyruvate, water dikinase
MLQNDSSDGLIASFAAVGKDDVSLAGGKGANLGELTRAGVRVPPGLIVTADAYFRFLEEAGLRPEIERLLRGLDCNDRARLEGVAMEAKDIVTSAPMPAWLVSPISAAYENMGAGTVAVRSSATAEDLAEASCAGQQSTYLNVEGKAEVVRAVQKCWASLFEPQAIFYRARVGFDHGNVGMGVVVQRMVQADRSGVMFTINPVTNDDCSMVIEAVFGLGEAVVSGLVTPDMYVVDKASGAIADRQIVAQEQELVRRPNVTRDEEQCHWVPVPFERRFQPKLSDDEIGELAAIGRRIEDHFTCPQDIEWAWNDGKFWIVQARPVTSRGS